MRRIHWSKKDKKVHVIFFTASVRNRKTPARDVSTCKTGSRDIPGEGLPVPTPIATN
jgi:hypothetical protein